MDLAESLRIEFQAHATSLRLEIQALKELMRSESAAHLREHNVMDAKEELLRAEMNRRLHEGNELRKEFKELLPRAEWNASHNHVMNLLEDHKKDNAKDNKVWQD